ncbi:hypothetical protein PHYPSEUDO_010838 [Phytophthora pseudosyringae]|uniref:Short chain dehydrogenase n=1 Tax=Phytophthora pseudosyringae TaxID=221518 RepID=A0A8T1V9E9_9STRA|nr:hypothetical protein PHYPSEUDO_010838 [Phytophthora pseudosyringae]
MPSTYLGELRVVKIIQIDTSDEESVIAAAKQLQGQPIDVLINNAGIGGRDDFDKTTKAEMMQQFEVNAVGRILMTRAFLPNLELAVAKSGSVKVAHVSSCMGSIACNDIGGLYGYRASKVALNMVNSSLAHDLGNHKIIALAMSPEYVNTRMTEHKGQTSPEDSAAGMANVMAEATLQESGKFYNFTGDRLPW